jgi:hypothetical protein
MKQHDCLLSIRKLFWKRMVTYTESSLLKALPCAWSIRFRLWHRCRCGPEPACGRAPTASQEGSLKVRFALYKIAETVRLNAIGEDSKQQKPRQMARGCLDS